MESFVLSNQSLRNLDMIEADIKLSLKTAAYLDLSNNILE